MQGVCACVRACVRALHMHACMCNYILLKVHNTFHYCLCHVLESAREVIISRKFT